MNTLKYSHGSINVIKLVRVSKKGSQKQLFYLLDLKESLTFILLRKSLAILPNALAFTTHPRSCHRSSLLRCHRRTIPAVFGPLFNSPRCHVERKKTSLTPTTRNLPTSGISISVVERMKASKFPVKEASQAAGFHGV